MFHISLTVRIYKKSVAQTDYYKRILISAQEPESYWSTMTGASNEIDYQIRKCIAESFFGEPCEFYPTESKDGPFCACNSDISGSYCSKEDGEKCQYAIERRERDGHNKNDREQEESPGTSNGEVHGDDRREDGQGNQRDRTSSSETTTDSCIQGPKAEGNDL
ncbi:hypothetical protein AYK24_06605 [Thermoplasmatales archaeon SG8-52-4]|nr:MAG: hypothetical protein AYK24_06605 [Thermoplasmatales archaeon SG8-52-4]